MMIILNDHSVTFDLLGDIFCVRCEDLPPFDSVQLVKY